LNYNKDGINYGKLLLYIIIMLKGIFFMQPVDVERDEAPNYYEIIKNPMDFGTIINRIYLEYYKNP